MAAGDLTLSEVVGAGGTATITVRVANGISRWTVSQVSVELPTAPSGATCDVRKNGYLVSPAIPTGDTVAGEPPVLLDPGDALTINWAGCTAGTVAKALVFYDDGMGP